MFTIHITCKYLPTLSHFANLACRITEWLQSLAHGCVPCTMGTMPSGRFIGSLLKCKDINQHDLNNVTLNPFFFFFVSAVYNCVQNIQKQYNITIQIKALFRTILIHDVTKLQVRRPNRLLITKYSHFSYMRGDDNRRHYQGLCPNKVSPKTTDLIKAQQGHKT